jgi:hypothetical protein
VLILVRCLLLPGFSYLYQKEERLRLSWFGAEKGFLPIAYTTTMATTPHSVVHIQTKGRGRRRHHAAAGAMYAVQRHDIAVASMGNLL